MKNLIRFIATNLIFLPSLVFAQNTFPSSGNVGIGTTSPAYSLDVYGSILGISSPGWNNSLSQFQSYNALALSGTAGTLSNQYINYGLWGAIGLDLSSNFADYSTSRYSNFSGVGSTVYKSNSGALTLGVASGFSSNLLVSGSGSISEYASFRSSNPLQSYGLANYSGTITNYYGLLLESSQAPSEGISSQITNKFGVYQKGTSDINYFEGKVGIGTSNPSELLTVFNGTTTGTYTTSGWVSSSDKRLKNNIEKVSKAMSIINQLDGVYYEWINNKEAGRQIGFIAQDVKKVLPEVVIGFEGDLKKGEVMSMAYQNIVPVLVEAMKEKDKEIKTIKQMLDSLINILNVKSQQTSTIAEKFGGGNLNKVVYVDLKQNIPNPFKSQTVISFSLLKDGFVSVDLYDSKGMILQNIESGLRKHGTYNVAIKGENLPSGNYFYVLTFNGERFTKQAIKL